MCCDTYIPRPVPPRSPVPLEYRWKSRFCCCTDMPGPLSLTEMSTSLSRRIIRTVTRASPSLPRTALVTRLTTTCFTRLGSTYMRIGGSNESN